MVKQVCPHCRKMITDQDVVDFSSQLKKEALEDEFSNSNENKTFEKWSVVIGISSFAGMIMSILFLALGRSGNENGLIFSRILIIAPLFAGIVILSMLMKKQKRLLNQFVKKRLV